MKILLMVLILCLPIIALNWLATYIDEMSSAANKLN